MNLTGKQWIAVGIAVLGVLMVSNAQLTDLFGPVAAKYIGSAAGLINMGLGSVLAAISGQMPQDQQVRQVLAMPGVQSIDINRNASPALAALAVDPAQPKIAAVPKDLQAVAETAKTAAGT